MFKQFNVPRKLLDTGTNDISDDLESVRKSAQTPLLQRAVVVDVFHDPTVLTEEVRSRLFNTVINPEFVSIIPRNAITARIVSNSGAVGNDNLQIFFPLFPPHFCFPIKPGEQVFVIFEDPFQDTSSGYWISRIHENNSVDDINFTHADRRFNLLNDPANSTLSGTERRGVNLKPSFPNGLNTPETFTLAFEDSSPEKAYDRITLDATANRDIFYEPVPRFSKRPGDLLLQGSNNTLICLGEDRTGGVSKNSETNRVDKRDFSGTIDVVVGRARKLPENENISPGSNNVSPTAPLVIENTRSKKETLKTPFLFNKQDNPNEGNPDFVRDMSRIYISMKTAGDKNFLIDKPTIELTEKLKFPITDPSQETGSPYIILKSDHLRFIARNKVNGNEGDSVSGDIRIVKEGSKNSDLSFINIDSAGNQTFFGKSFQLQTPTDNGKAYFLTTTENEPYMKYTVFKSIIEDLENQVAALTEAYNSLATALTTTIGLPVAPGSPDPAWPILLTQIRIANTTLATKIQTNKTTIEQKTNTNIKSTKLFGV